MCWVIKIGTSTITDTNGEIDDVILNNLLDNITRLSQFGEKIIIISSGAVACGRQILDNQTLEMEPFLAQRTRASIGQPYLYHKYHQGLSKSNIITSQVLLQDSDFQEKDRLKSIKTMLLNLLEQGVIPILNENDAITVRQQDYQDNIGKILWDNDSLATLVAQTVKASHLLLCSNIDGVYDDQNQIIQHWNISYMAKLGNVSTSNYGRGGILSKLQAAIKAARQGIHTYIINGKRPNIIQDIYSGEPCQYTYFPINNTEPNDEIPIPVTTTIQDKIKKAKGFSRNLKTTGLTERREWLLSFRDLLLKHSSKIIKINKEDLTEAQNREISAPLYHRLRITDKTILNLVNGLTDLTKLDDPVHKVLESKIIKHPFSQDKELVWSRSQIPLGLIFVIFESRPDVLVQLLSLALLSGNGMILKGGREAEKTLTYLYQLFQKAVPPDNQEGYHLLFTREEAEEALSSPDLDLCIPRGSRRFIDWVKTTSVAPVIGHGDGICCAYLHKDISLSEPRVLDLIRHSKLDYMAACNALEVLLLHEEQIRHPQFSVALETLKTQGIVIRADKKICRQYPELNLVEDVTIKEHGNNHLTLLPVTGLEEAINFINLHGSQHTDLIITDDREVENRFLTSLASSCVFVNCSTRCADGYRMKMGCEVGINTQPQSWFRGPVGLEALMTTQIHLKPV